MLRNVNKRVFSKIYLYKNRILIKFTVKMIWKFIQINKIIKINVVSCKNGFVMFVFFNVLNNSIIDFYSCFWTKNKIVNIYILKKYIRNNFGKIYYYVIE